MYPPHTTLNYNNVLFLNTLKPLPSSTKVNCSQRQLTSILVISHYTLLVGV